MVAPLADRPAQERIAGGLHDPAADYDPLALVYIPAVAREGFQDRATRLLALEEQGIVLARHQEHNAAEGADAPDADDFHRMVHEPETVEGQSHVVRQALPVADKRLPDMPHQLVV